MSPAYRLSIYAERDLADIFSYTLETWGELQLDRYEALMEDALKRLAEDPEGPGTKSRDELFPHCRSCYAGSHVILFRVRGQTVEIARILHQSMDLQRHVPPGYSKD
jgi:toxin ParE1/3/4